jgi:hypothetical protein
MKNFLLLLSIFSSFNALADRSSGSVYDHIRYSKSDIGKEVLLAEFRLGDKFEVIDKSHKLVFRVNGSTTYMIESPSSSFDLGLLWNTKNSINSAIKATKCQRDQKKVVIGTIFNDNTVWHDNMTVNLAAIKVKCLNDEVVF